MFIFILLFFFSLFAISFFRGCCASMFDKLLCCKKKSVVESRRTSMNSKKQSIAPTLPPEDTRPKLDESLVDHTSIMKAAIPVMPVGLAWFCLICNCLIPGSGMYLLICTSIGITCDYNVHMNFDVALSFFILL